MRWAGMAPWRSARRVEWSGVIDAMILFFQLGTWLLFSRRCGDERRCGVTEPRESSCASQAPLVSGRRADRDAARSRASDQASGEPPVFSSFLPKKKEKKVQMNRTIIVGSVSSKVSAVGWQIFTIAFMFGGWGCIYTYDDNDDDDDHHHRSCRFTCIVSTGSTWNPSRVERRCDQHLVLARLLTTLLLFETYTRHYYYYYYYYYNTRTLDLSLSPSPLLQDLPLFDLAPRPQHLFDRRWRPLHFRMPKATMRPIDAKADLVIVALLHIRIAMLVRALGSCTLARGLEARADGHLIGIVLMQERAVLAAHTQTAEPVDADLEMEAE